MHTNHHGAVAVTALLVLSLTAGCIGGLPVGSAIDADAVGEQVAQRHSTLEGYTATVTRTVSVGDSTSQARATVTVRDDRRVVQYTHGPHAGEAVTSAADASPVFDAAVGAEGAGSTSSYAAVAERLVATSNVSVQQVTTVDARRVAVVDLAPTADDSPANLTRTVWVDLDRQIPTKIETSWTTDTGETATVTVEYDDVTLFESNHSTSAGVTA